MNSEFSIRSIRSFVPEVVQNWAPPFCSTFRGHFRAKTCSSSRGWRNRRWWNNERVQGTFWCACEVRHASRAEAPESENKMRKVRRYLLCRSLLTVRGFKNWIKLAFICILHLCVRSVSNCILLLLGSVLRRDFMNDWKPTSFQCVRNCNIGLTILKEVTMFRRCTHTHFKVSSTSWGVAGRHRTLPPPLFLQSEAKHDENKEKRNTPWDSNKFCWTEWQEAARLLSPRSIWIWRGISYGPDHFSSSKNGK